MAIWQYTFWIDYKWNIKDILADLETIFGSKVEKKDNIIYFSDWSNICHIFLEDNSIFCRLNLIDKKKLEEKLGKLKEISKKYKLRFLIWEEYIWEQELDYNSFIRELYNSNNMKFVKWNYEEIFSKYK